MMSDYDNYGVEPMTVKQYRKYVLAAYSVSGFCIAALVFFCAMDSMDAEVSVWLAEAFIAIIGVFTWVGGAIANSIYSVEDSRYPWDHGWALLKSPPLGILSLGILLVAILVAMQIPFPEALGFIGLGYGAWVRWLVTSREGPIAPSTTPR